MSAPIKNNNSDVRSLELLNALWSAVLYTLDAVTPGEKAHALDALRKAAIPLTHNSFHIADEGGLYSRPLVGTGCRSRGLSFGDNLQGERVAGTPERMGAPFGNVPATEPILQLIKLIPQVLACGGAMRDALADTDLWRRTERWTYWSGLTQDVLDEMDANARGESRAVLGEYAGVKA